jgi:hypothetical protein
MKNSGTGRCGVSPQDAPSVVPTAIGAALLAFLLMSARGMAGDANAPDPLPGAALSSANAPAAAWPEGIDPSQTSADPTYGYTRDNPVQLGSPDPFGGPAMSKVYLRHLRDRTFKPFRFDRDGSFGPGPDGHILDRYTLVDSEGKPHQIFIDMYHPENNPLKCMAPAGMYFWK